MFSYVNILGKERDAFKIRISAKSLPVLQGLLKDIMPSMMLHKIPAS